MFFLHPYIYGLPSSLLGFPMKNMSGFFYRHRNAGLVAMFTLFLGSVVTVAMLTKEYGIQPNAETLAPILINP